MKRIAQLEEFSLGDNPTANGDLKPYVVSGSAVWNIYWVFMTQIADPLKVRNAGAMTCPPDGVTRKTASPR